MVSDSFFEWPDWPQQTVVWLRALATRPKYRGQGVGAIAIASALELTGKGNELYLDCVAGFLPAYYQRFGFSEISSRVLKTQNEESFDIVLMRHKNQI